MKKILVTLGLITVLLSGCATVRGVGKDMETTGEWIQKNVSGNQEEAPSHETDYGT